MRVGIDITPMAGIRMGVGNYCYYLLKHLARLASDCEFHGLTSGLSTLDRSTLPDGMVCRRTRIPTRALYRMWSLFNAPGRPGSAGPAS